MDLAELDALLVDKENGILAVEIMLSRNNLGGLAKEISYKTHLLNLLFERDIRFILVSMEDIADSSDGRILGQRGGCYFVRSDSIFEILGKLTFDQVQNHHVLPRSLNKGIMPELLPVTGKFSYRHIHEENRKRLLDALRMDADKESIKQTISEPLLARLIVGKLDMNSIEYLLENWEFTVNGEKVDPERIRTIIPRVILVLGLPELRPGLYFYSKYKSFVKFGPFKNREFGCESIIFQWSTTFFHSLEKEHLPVSSRFVTQLLERLVTPEVIGPKVRKRRFKEERKVIRDLFGIAW